MTKKEEKTRKAHKVRTPYTYEERPGKKFFGLSKTVPDQAIPLRVLLDRHTRGLPLNASQRIPLFEGEEETQMSNGINMAMLDLAELEQLSKENYDYLLKQKSIYDDELKTRQIAKENERIEAEIKRRLESAKDGKGSSVPSIDRKPEES